MNRKLPIKSGFSVIVLSVIFMVFIFDKSGLSFEKPYCLYIKTGENLCKKSTMKKIIKRFQLKCINKKNTFSKFIVLEKSETPAKISRIAKTIKQYLGYKFHLCKCSCFTYTVISNIKNCYTKKRAIESVPKKDLNWDNEIYKISQEEKLKHKLKPISVNKLFKKNNKQSRGFLKNVTVERYLFIDLYAVNSQKRQCLLKGQDFFAKAGIRFAWTIDKKFLSLWGDVYGRVSYQKFMESSQKKAKPGIRYLFLTNESLNDAKYRYPGFYIMTGRIPLRDKQTLLYNNFLDGIKIKYRSTLFKGFLFAGKRIRDPRTGSFEEPTGIGGYDYIIGSIDYQYLYRHHIKAFFIREKYPHIVKDANFTIWNTGKRKTDLKWLALRLKKDGNTEYWLNLAYMWGKRERLLSKYIDCTARKKIEGYMYNNDRGYGIDAGMKFTKKRWGIGGRLAFGQGSKDRKKDFHLPRLSSRMDNLFGPNKIRYYGELANPGLSNIGIISLFGGYEIYPYNWLEVNLINYLSLKKSGTIPFSRYFYETNRNKHWLGMETDIIFDGNLKRKFDKWRYLFVLSYFAASDAFGGLKKKNSIGLFIRIKRYW